MVVVVFRVDWCCVVEGIDYISRCPSNQKKSAMGRVCVCVYWVSLLKCWEIGKMKSTTTVVIDFAIL